MSKGIRPESPLARYLSAHKDSGPAGDAAVELSEHPFLGHLILRGEPKDPRFRDAVNAVLGTVLPLEPNTTATGRKATVLWLGPDEWLVLTGPEQVRAVAEALETSLRGLFAAVTDVSGGQTVIHLRGRRARDVLAKGCALDLHPRAFGSGRCAQTRAARATVLIRLVDDAPSFDLVVRRSFAEYLARWLVDAGQEYGLRVVTPRTAGVPPATL